MFSNQSEEPGKSEGWWPEHGRPILLYLLLTCAFTWPLIAHFTTQIPGDGYDAYNGVWVMWHTREAVLGQQPFFDLPTLYYPYGASLLTHVPGVATGFFALPFWFLGPEAAHNGAVIISFVLTGYLTYLLGRTIGLKRPFAFFAGLLLFVAPMHLLGLRGHTTKVFLGAAPLVLLCLFRALDLSRRRRSWLKWALFTGLALLFALLHDSFQFLTAAATVLLVALFALGTTPAAGRWRLLGRLAVVAAVSLLTSGPLVLRTAAAALDPQITFDLNLLSYDYQPDLLEFVIPSPQSALLGSAAADRLAAMGIEPLIETAVAISWVALPLLLIAAWRGRRPARFWLLFTLVWVALALGPTLRVANRTTFTEYDLPIIMPYAFLAGLPGLDFLRTPGRFMQIGFLGVAITAAWGLAWLCRRWPRSATWLTVSAMALVLLESWPQPWQMIPLRPVPEFYQSLATDEAMYGVLDLPQSTDYRVPYVMYNATYQMYQMTHGKGIAMGYISRTYGHHPIFACVYSPPDNQSGLTVDDRPAPCPFHPLYDLPLNNYRYVVIHKPQTTYFDYRPGAWGQAQAAAFVNRYLRQQQPIVDDALTTVYAMPPLPDESVLTTSLGFGANWYGWETVGGDSWRWAATPAQLILSSDTTQDVVLEITFSTVYVDPEKGDDHQSRLEVTLDDGYHTVVAIAAGEQVAIPLTLTPGRHNLTLTLEDGVFQPAAAGGGDLRTLSFAIRRINLRTSAP